MDESVRNVEGVLIPPGYVLFNRNIHDIDVLKDRIRWLNNAVCFVFDPENGEYLDFLQQCRNDTAALSLALEQEFSNRVMPFTTQTSKKIKGSKASYKRVSFLIRPVFFSTEIDTQKTDKNRWQSHPDRDVLVLHFDPAHNFQFSRCNVPTNIDPCNLGSYELRNILSGIICEHAREMSECYGAWKAMASQICDYIKEAEEIIQS